jgi:hypothetical protein
MPPRPRPRHARALARVAFTLASGACVPPEHVPKDSPVAAPVSAPTHVPADSSDHVAEPAPSTDEPVPTDSSGAAAAPASAPTSADPVWWCACHGRAGSPPVPATACRAEPDACERLAHKARHGGGPGIAPASLTHRCREIHAAHPGDVLGARDRWQPGDRPGNWLSVGLCHLPGPADVPPGPPSILDDERLGELRIGLAAARVFELLGPPARRDAATLSKETGTYHQPWHYPDRGLELRFEAGEKKGPYVLAAVRAFAPATLRSARGVGLGDPHAAVERAYAGDRGPGTDGRRFIVGAPRRGVIFTLDPGTRVVTEIFLGTTLE